MRRSILDRLDDRANALTPDLDNAPSPVHAATVTVLSDLLSMGNRLAGDDTPTHLRVMMRTLEHSRPMLLESMRGIPAEQIRAFMAELADRIRSIVDAPEQ